MSSYKNNKFLEKISFLNEDLNPAFEEVEPLHVNNFEVPEIVEPEPEPFIPFPMADNKRRDLELYHSWKQTGSKRALTDLVKQLHPLIFSEVRRVAGTLPESALSAEAKKWAIKGIETFDPDKGVALSTHVVNYLQKTRRLNYKYQNAARLPENMQLQYTEFKNVISHLENELDREPTDKEIAKTLGWSEPLVVRFKGSLYDDLVESASQKATESTQFSVGKLQMDHITSQLNDQEKIILDGVAQDLSSAQLAAKLGVNISRLNYLKGKLRQKIQSIKTEIEMF